MSLAESKSLPGWCIMVKVIPVNWCRKQTRVCLLGVCYAGQRKRRLITPESTATFPEDCDLV